MKNCWTKGLQAEEGRWKHSLCLESEGETHAVVWQADSKERKRWPSCGVSKRLRIQSGKMSLEKTRVRQG